MGQADESDTGMLERPRPPASCFALCKTGEKVLHNGLAVEWHRNDGKRHVRQPPVLLVQNRRGGLA